MKYYPKAVLLPLLYSVVISFLLILRATPLNRCGSTGSIFVGCIGYPDILIGFFIIPGLFFWFLLSGIPPTSIIFKQLEKMLEKNGLHDFLILLLTGWFFSLLFFFVTGILWDRKKQKSR